MAPGRVAVHKSSWLLDASRECSSSRKAKKSSSSSLSCCFLVVAASNLKIVGHPSAGRSLLVRPGPTAYIKITVRKEKYTSVGHRTAAPLMMDYFTLLCCLKRFFLIGSCGCSNRSRTPPRGTKMCLVPCAWWREKSALNQEKQKRTSRFFMPAEMARTAIRWQSGRPPSLLIHSEVTWLSSSIAAILARPTHATHSVLYCTGVYIFLEDFANPLRLLDNVSSFVSPLLLFPIRSLRLSYHTHPNTTTL